MIPTGMLVSEIVGLHACNVHLGTGAQARVLGKEGRGARRRH